MANKAFRFEISLSVLNHLGRHLYRSFATVLGEAISNAWDADARNVWIYVDRNKNEFWIKDDGVGMNADDFQNKFLKIGYSKRTGGARSPKRKRPYIGRKGIGKLAMLSCAKRISIISKKEGARKYVGGTIDNSALDQAITEDLTPQQYPLSDVDIVSFARYTKGHPHGTIIRFVQFNDGVGRSFDFMTKIIALYFRFALIDRTFKIHLNDERITHKHLASLLDSSQFLWKIGYINDPFIVMLEKAFAKEDGHEVKGIKLGDITGFIASVRQPRDLKVMTTDERVGIDLFVNGRIRERDILKHVPTSRIVENYLYGQIHFNSLDDSVDRFTSSREGVVADDPKFRKFLEQFKKVLAAITEDWDAWRIKHRQEGDPDNPRVPKSRRAALNLYEAVAGPFVPEKGTKKFDEVDRWVGELNTDAAFNFESYAECFVSENLVRRFIAVRKIPLSAEAKSRASEYRRREAINKKNGNVSIDIRKNDSDLSYLAMDELANLVDKGDKAKDACLPRDAVEFKPIRDALAHTALLTDVAKKRLTSVRENIKGRVSEMLKKDA